VIGLIVLVIILTILYKNNKAKAIKNKIISDQKREVDRFNKELIEKNHEIRTQAEELNKANEEIQLINENLEKTVQQRTSKIKLQNEKLKEYAFSNSHKVRAPLARLMGLINLWKRESVTGKEREFIIDNISYSAQELDGIIREIAQILKEDDSN